MCQLFRYRDHIHTKKYKDFQNVYLRKKSISNFYFKFRSSYGKRSKRLANTRGVQKVIEGKKLFMIEYESKSIIE